MCHYSCDLCGKALDAPGEPRYRVTVEGHAAGEDDTALDDLESDADSVDAMDELLTEQVAFEAVEEDNDPEIAPAGTRKNYDLCRGCYARMLNDPLGLETRKALRFSRN